MRRVAYRELEVPSGLEELLIDTYGPFVLPIRAVAITPDNLVLFHDIITVSSEVYSLYIVCDPVRVLRYGLARWPTLYPDVAPFPWAMPLDFGSWTWDGKSVWPLVGWDVDVFTCEVDTMRNTCGPAVKVFDGSYRDASSGLSGLYMCYSANWAATGLTRPRAILASTVDVFQARNDEGRPEPCNYTFAVRYLPTGATVLSFSVVDPECFSTMFVIDAFPVGPAATAYYVTPGGEGLIYIILGDRVVLDIPIRLIDPSPPMHRYIQTTAIGLPYDLVETGPSLLQCSGSTLTLFFPLGKRLSDWPHGPLVDVLVEIDLDSGRAVKDLVVPSPYHEWPSWGFSHNGAMLATPMMTSRKGRIKLP
jgi:hypothetical protein